MSHISLICDHFTHPSQSCMKRSLRPSNSYKTNSVAVFYTCPVLTISRSGPVSSFAHKNHHYKILIFCTKERLTIRVWLAWKQAKWTFQLFIDIKDDIKNMIPTKNSYFNNRAVRTKRLLFRSLKNIPSQWTLFPTFISVTYVRWCSLSKK